MDNEFVNIVCEDRRVMRAIRLASQDLTKRPSVTEISRAVGLSPTHFSRRFYLMTGLRFVQWSTGIRISEAKELLRVIDLSITAVAAAVGYEDVTTFERVFRKRERMCPRKYRLTVLNARTAGTGTVRAGDADSGVESADLRTRNAETLSRARR